MGTLEGKSTDGLGGINQQAVDRSGRAVVRADTETDMNHAMGIGLGFIFHSTYSLTSDQEALYLRNDGLNIHIHRITVSTSASGVVEVFRQTGGTAAGTTITGKNGILGRSVMPNVTAFGNAEVSGSVVGELLLSQDIGTASPYDFDTEDLLLPDTEAIVVRFLTTGVVHVTLFCFREIS